MATQANQRKIQQVASIAAGVTVLATVAAVVIHRRRQYARAQHAYRRALQVRPALQITPGPKFRLEMYNEVWCKEFVRY